MALVKIHRKWENETVQTTQGEPEFVGQVLDIFQRCERIMSDVWDHVSYAEVLLDDGSTRTICLGGTEFGPEYLAKIDADPAVIADWKARKEAEQQEKLAAQLKAQAEEEAERYEAACMRNALAPHKGRTVAVHKGRKVPKGTTGVVVWEGSDAYRGEARIGIKDAQGQIHYTAAENATANVTKPEGMTWAEFVDKQLKERPVQNEGAQILATGQVGLCFYAVGDRFGIALTSRKEQGRYVDVVWANLDEVVRVEGPITLPAGEPKVRAPVIEDDIIVPF